MSLKIQRLVLLMGLGASISLILGCSCKPILYKPTADPIPMLLAINVPDNITSLSSFPRDTTIAENGTNVRVGGRQPGDVKEMFELFRSDGSSVFLGATFRITLYESEDAAKRGYVYARRNIALFSPPFREDKAEHRDYYFAHLNQARSDPEGFCLPMDYYHSEVVFRLQNLVVTITCAHNSRNSDLLMSSVKYFTEQLKKSLGHEKTE